MFRINTYILNCDLVAEVLPQCLPTDAEYACYLYCGKEVLVKRTYQKEPSFRFPLDAPGSYYVRVFARWKPSGQQNYEIQAVNGRRQRFVGKDYWRNTAPSCAPRKKTRRLRLCLSSP